MESHLELNRNREFLLESARNRNDFWSRPITRKQKLFQHEGGKFHHTKMYFSCDEVSIASKLNQTINKFPEVTLGSYPEMFHSYYKTKVTYECLDETKLFKAVEYLKSLLDSDVVVDYVPDPISDPWVHFKRLDSEMYSLFEDALEVINESFEKYSPDEVCLCFNGGKDCLVVLHMTFSYLLRNYPGHKLQAVYITERNNFPQVNEFVNQSINRYNLDCEIIPGPLKGALSELQKKRPLIKAMFMGTRRGDPHGERLGLFSPTDGDWPPLMRINPIIDWKYEHVWRFIRQLFLPYCSLYDRGFTSLGNLKNTVPNPMLQRSDNFGRITFLPAHHLQDGSLERKGRVF